MPLFLVIILLGAIAVAFFIATRAFEKIKELSEQLKALKHQLDSLEQKFKGEAVAGGASRGDSEAAPEASSEESRIEPPEIALPEIVVPESRPTAPASPTPNVSEVERPYAKTSAFGEECGHPPRQSGGSAASEQPSLQRRASAIALEMKLGTKWLNWIGILMLLVGIAFFLKYAYDNEWVGPKGRLAIGTLLGVASFFLGERFRRKEWSVVFHVFCGGGLAIFYLCVFFSFQVYHLTT